MTTLSIATTTRSKKKTFLHLRADDGATYWTTRTMKRSRTMSPSTRPNRLENMRYLLHSPTQTNIMNLVVSPTARKAKGPARGKRSSSTSNVWARFGFSADTSTSTGTSAPPAKNKPATPRTRGTKATRATTRGTGRGTRGQRGHAVPRHTYFD